MNPPIRFNKQIIFYLIPIILIIAMGIFLLISKPWQNQSKNEPKKEVKLLDYESQEYGFRLKYPDDFIQGKIAEEDKKKNPIMLKLVSVEPPALVLPNSTYEVEEWEWKMESGFGV